MPNNLQNEAAVLAAVNRLLTTGQSGTDSADAMALLVDETSSIPLNSLDAWERRIRTELWAFEQKPKTAWWRFRKSGAGIASWLDLCSGDGFRREQILRTFSGGAPNAFLLSLAMRRLNDWVPEVRAAARERLTHIAECSDPEHVVDALWQVFAHCSSWGRMQDEDRRLLGDLTSIKKVSLALGSRIVAAAAGPATQILAQAGRNPALDERLLEFARHAVQPSVRAKAYRCLLEGRMVWAVGRKWRWTEIKWCKGRFEPVLRERAIENSGSLLANLKFALLDRSPLVRRVAAEILIKEMRMIGADAVGLAEKLASDPSEYVAERGRFALANLVVPDEQQNPEGS
jgi:hypothetical protein